jgi:hypothetical protein
MKRIMGITLIIIGAVSLTVGIICLTQSNAAAPLSTTQTSVVTTTHNETASSSQPATSVEEPLPTTPEHTQEHSQERTQERTQEPAPTQSPKTSSEEKGQAFENLIVNLLADNRFKLLDRTQDTKSTAGVYAESCKNPDLHIEQTHTPRSIDYYIECKYRSRWYEGKVQFEDYQVKRYKEFQGKQRRKVLFALGVGGTPSAPQELMIVPLDQLQNGAILQANHESYKIEATSDALYTYVSNYFTQVFAAKRK